MSGDYYITMCGSTRRSPEELERILTTNRLIQLRSGSLSSSERALLDDVHAAWLPTYTAALHSFDPLASLRTDTARFDATGTRRRLALACAPFRALLHRTLQVTGDAANQAAGRELTSSAIIEAWEGHLIDRFELALAWAIEADQNVAFARLGISKDHATTDDHGAYFDRTFHDTSSYHRFYLRFPVLGRWLATVAQQLCANGQLLVHRLHADTEEISSELFGEPILRFTSLDLGKGDYHGGGRSVAMVGAALESGPGSFVYKPRCIGSEAAMQGLLEHLTAEGVIGFAPHRVMARDGYGYEQRIPTNRNQVQSRQAAERIYEELGGFLAILYVLGGSDLHYENVMVAGGHAFVCDCETILGVLTPGQQPAVGTILDSVYRTGLLEWPLPPTADVVLRLSGCAGGQSYDIPWAVPRLQEGPTLAVRHETGIRVEQDAPNRIHLDGEVLEPRDFEDSIVSGFSRVYEWFKAFTPARVKRMQSRIVSAAGVLTDHMAPPDSVDLTRVDLIRSFIFPLQVIVTCDLLGVPAHHRRSYHRLAAAMQVPTGNKGRPDTSQQAYHRMSVLIADALATKREQICRTDSPDLQPDLLSALISVRDDSDGLTAAETQAMAMLLISAGQEPTIDLIANGMLGLLLNPTQLHLFHKHPELRPQVVEEFLRCGAPVLSAHRIAAEDIEIDGTIVRRGNVIAVMLDRAHRDPSQFPEPDALDIARKRQNHLAFGHGIHLLCRRSAGSTANNRGSHNTGDAFSSHRPGTVTRSTVLAPSGGHPRPRRAARNTGPPRERK